MDAVVERRFGRFVIQPGRRQLLIDGKPAKIGARAFDVLMALVERRQRVVTKEELLDLVWPGIAVEESNLQVHIFALRKALGADAIVTIPGRGYQFAAPLEDQPTVVAATSSPLRSKIDAETLAGSKSGKRAKFPDDFRRGSVVLAAFVIAIILAGGAWYLLRTTSPAPVALKAPASTEAGHLSIVVLPFTNLSNDPGQDYFADGITENLTTDLSRVRNSFVIARNTAFTFKARDLDAKAIGTQLGVRYVLQGSVQRDQNRVRIDAQLVDAQSGATLWADRFEEGIADLFMLQDQVVARLANTLGFELVKAEAQRGLRNANPDAVDLHMRGWALVRTPQQTMDKNNAARALFEQALKLDPDDADALAGDAYTYVNEFLWGRNTQTDYDAKVLGQADRAIALAPDTLWAYYAKCVYLYYSQRADKAVSAANGGLAINPNFGPLWSVRGIAEIFLGHFERAEADMKQGFLLNPRDPLAWFAHWYLGDAELGLRHFDAAIAEYNKSIDSGFLSCLPHAGLAAAYALEGKMDEARSALAETRRLEPALTVKWLIARYPDIPPLLEGLRKAGLPEESSDLRPGHLFPVECQLPCTPPKIAEIASPTWRPLSRTAVFARNGHTGRKANPNPFGRLRPHSPHSGL